MTRLPLPIILIKKFWKIRQIWQILIVDLWSTKLDSKLMLKKLGKSLNGVKLGFGISVSVVYKTDTENRNTETDR